MKILWILLITLDCVVTISILPSDQFVSVAQGNAAFTCLLTGEFTEVQWLVNNTDVESLGLANVEITLSSTLGVGTLEFFDIPIEYNNTRIQCKAEQSGRIETSQATELILVQGSLAAVQSLQATKVDSSIYITWNAPPSLSIDSINNDLISYCLEIVNLNTSEVLLNQCDVEVTEFYYLVAASAMCHDFKIIVTPVNFVGRGASKDFLYLIAEASPGVMEPVQRSIIMGDILFTLTTSAVVCSAELTLQDRNDTNNMVFLRSIDLDIEGSNITLNSSSLIPNRFYSVRCSASNARGLETSNSSLCTHDLMNIMLTEDNQIEIDFREPSDAIGAMIDFLFMGRGGNIDFSRSFFLPCSRHDSHNVTLDPGSYVVHGYDIEHNGMLHGGVGFPAVTHKLTILEDTYSPSQQLSRDIEDCHIYATSVNIIVKCTTSISVVTGFQAVAQLYSTSEVSKLYVNQSTDLQTAITITVETDGLYRVTVFAIGDGIMFDSLPYTDTVLIDQGKTGSVTSIIPFVIPSLAVLLPVMLIVVVSAIVCNRKMKCRPKINPGTTTSGGNNKRNKEKPCRANESPVVINSSDAEKGNFEGQKTSNAGDNMEVGELETAIGVDEVQDE